jgi:hypothetical protein
VHVFPHVTGTASPFGSIGLESIGNFPNVSGGYAPVNPVGTISPGSGGVIGPLASSTKSGDPPTQPKIAEASVSVSGDLDKTVVRRITRSRFATFRACYVKALKATPTLHGVVNTSFQIAAAGSVASATTSSSMGDASMDACVRGVFQSLTFPSSSGATSVVYPLAFTS